MKKSNKIQRVVLLLGCLCCIVIGLGIILFPYFDEAKNENLCDQLLEDYKEGLVVQNKLESSKDENSQSEYNSKEDDLKEEDLKIDKVENFCVFGILRIPSIELELPILQGIEEKALGVSITMIEPYCDITEHRNMVLAGHHSRVKGRHFNRLEEVKVDDVIEIETDTHIGKYKVYDRFATVKEDVSVLEQEEDVVTLITCYYEQGQETKRWIVKAKRVGLNEK